MLYFEIAPNQIHCKNNLGFYKCNDRIRVEKQQMLYSYVDQGTGYKWLVGKFLFTR